MKKKSLQYQINMAMTAAVLFSSFFFLFIISIDYIEYNLIFFFMMMLYMLIFNVTLVTIVIDYGGKIKCKRTKI